MVGFVIFLKEMILVLSKSRKAVESIHVILGEGGSSAQ